MFYKAGCKLIKPAKVLQATDDYFDSEDWLKQFIDERCILGADKKVGARELLQEYQSWARCIGEYVRNRNDFRNALINHGYRCTRANQGQFWNGLSLNDNLIQ